jgi:type III restriction enzyme
VTTGSSGAAPALDPILNPPYDEPACHYVLGPQGPTGEIREGRRSSESFVPIPAVRKGRKGDDGSVQESLDVVLTAEKRERNDLINDLRREIERWRHRDYERVTPTSRKLLQHWADSTRENRVLFCQREAAETAIFIAEVAGRHGYADWRQRLEPFNAEHNAGLPRVALKMATGTGKTVVMAMLIAWQTANKVMSPHDARFTKRFLIVTPGITIRDRLQVLRPSSPSNYYKQRDLIPPDLLGTIGQAQIDITNYHSFLLRDAKEIRGVASNTREILAAGRDDDPFRETPDAMVSRVLRDLGTSKEQIVVFNDEAHHCYQAKSTDADGNLPKLTREEQESNEDARVWLRGLLAIARTTGIKTVYDLSATPYYLSGSGYHEGFIFPWTVSDFSLMDAIESGIVKIPRTPVDDDAEGDTVTYLRLWDHIGTELPKKRSPVTTVDTWIPPGPLEGALNSLYRSYRRAFEHWERELADRSEPPPVFIVVCPNTVVSKLVYDWIAGGEVADTGAYRNGNLALLSNVVEGKPLSRPRTVLVDSAQLESGDAMKPEFKAVATAEIETFKSELRARGRGMEAENLTDEDLLREVMNTVGKPGKLGGDVRCVVSVSMLTEGWDANTVTHILGIRAFGSQLLCEQVVGRGLRRRSYDVDTETGKFAPEYANIYGVPFAFIPSDRQTKDTPPLGPPDFVQSVEGREHLRITFPKLDGYRVEIPDEFLVDDLTNAERFPIGPSTVPTRTEIADIIGGSETDVDDLIADARPQKVAYAIAKQLLHAQMAIDGAPRLWHFPRLVEISRAWLDRCVDVAPGYSIGLLLGLAELRMKAVEAVFNTITVQSGNRRESIRPILRAADPVGDTSNVFFATRKKVEATEKSEVSHVTLDGKGGNTWEQLLAYACEQNDDVAAYVKNDHLGFTIPYVHAGQAHNYIPDFLLRLHRRPGEPFDRTLIVEVSGSQKSPGPTKEKATTVRDRWCVAVNNHGGFGRWGYVEITEMVGVREQLAEAIALLYDDAPIIGDPDLLDIDKLWRGERAAS